jgi:phage protein D/phage baseplate assembly protein gpV
LPDATTLLSQFYIKLSGADITAAMQHAIIEVRVEDSLHLPDVATITLADTDGRWVDDANLEPGRAIVIRAKAGPTEADLFDGEIVEVESHYTLGGRRLIVRAFDRMHRLARGRKVKSFMQVTDGDIFTEICQTVGLSCQVGPTPTVHKYVLQDNLSNLDFLRQRAAALGYLLFVEGRVLHCEEIGTASNQVEVTFGTELTEFHPRLTTIDQVDKATARGWDPITKTAIVGEASNGAGYPAIGNGKDGSAQAKSAFSLTTEALVADRPLRFQKVADMLAKATLDRRLGRFVEADGSASGNPLLVASASIKINGVGVRFSGTYFVTGTTHVYSSETGYLTHFTVSGFHPSTLLSALGTQPDTSAAPRHGLVIGIVTDNKDPENLGRVKVKFPWLSNDHASDWARIANSGGGASRGTYFLPEVNDEVLVGFEQGNINYPYILGGLWNGQDKPPKTNDEIVHTDGKVKQRIIESRTGHIVTLDDSEDKPGISIVDQTGKNKIEYDSKANKLTVHFEGDMFFDAPNGDVNVKGKTVTMEATTDFKIKGVSLTAEATQAATLKGANTSVEATAGMKVKGATTDVEASTKLGLSGSAMIEAKGGIIKLN